MKLILSHTITFLCVVICCLTDVCRKRQSQARVNASRLSVGTGFKVALTVCTTRFLHHSSENEFLLSHQCELRSAEST